MKAIITGTTGYLGGCVADYFVAKGIEVDPFTRQSGFVLGSSLVALSDRLAGADVLVHCSYDFRLTTWPDIFEINVTGSIALFEAAQQAGVRQLIFISSISAYDGCHSLYGRAKLEIERAVRRLGGVVIRPGLIFGDRPGGMVGRLKHVVSRLPVVPVVGGNRLQYLVHEQDLCQLIEALAVSTSRGILPMIAASERPQTFRNILDRLAKMQDRNVLFIPFPWQLLWVILRAVELFRMPMNFKSDSLIGLVKPDPRPDFSGTRAWPIQFREFE